MRFRPLAQFSDAFPCQPAEASAQLIKDALKRFEVRRQTAATTQTGVGCERCFWRGIRSAKTKRNATRPRLTFITDWLGEKAERTFGPICKLFAINATAEKLWQANDPGK
jgi:hypothetical protein